MHFIVGHWPGELLPPVWNNLFQRISEFPIGSGPGGGCSAASCWGCSKLHISACCAAVDLAVAHQCQFLAALTEASHCCLSLCDRVSVQLIIAQKSALDALGIPLVPMLYCSQMLALTLRSFTWFSCCQCSLSFWRSHCCHAFLSTHFKTSDVHLALEHQSCWLS